MSEIAERFETREPGAKQVDEKIRCDAGVSSPYSLVTASTPMLEC